jgi:vacuolar-type H+-ATPase subunit D/Vma8
MKQTAVEWLVETIEKNRHKLIRELFVYVRQAKEMEKNIAEEYAEFCIRCDRANLPIIKFDDWRKELTFKQQEQ